MACPAPEPSLLHLECRVISISNLNLIGLFSTERGKRDLCNFTPNAIGCVLNDLSFEKLKF